jgi:hypothetical protein
MSDDFKPYDNESDVIRIDHLEIENRVDRVTLMGDVVLTKDKAGLALAKELQALLGEIIQCLESDEKLPDAVQLKPTPEEDNPFF